MIKAVRSSGTSWSMASYKPRAFSVSPSVYAAYASASLVVISSVYACTEIKQKTAGKRIRWEQRLIIQCPLPAPGSCVRNSSNQNRRAILEWLNKAKKDTVPNEIFLKTASLEIAGSYWLRINELNAGLDPKLDEYPWIKGVIDKENNSIIIDSERVLGMCIFLNDKMVDLDEKVTIIINGKNRFEGKIERSLDKMLEIAFNNSAGDYEIYTNFMNLPEEE